MLPANRLRGHVEALIGSAGQVAGAAASLGADPSDAERQGEQRALVAGGAHKIVSQAGMLGLVRLSNAARALEEALREKTALEPARAAFQDAARDPEFHLLPLLGSGALPDATRGAAVDVGAARP